MKRFIPLIIIVLASLAITTSCSGEKKENPAEEISNFDVHEVLKSATRNFEVTIDGDKHYLTVYTSIQWPVKFGEANLQPLRDSLLVRMYEVAPGADVDRAILDFVNCDTIFGPDAKFTKIDNVPVEGPDVFEIQYTGKLVELTERTVTYQIIASSYLGGAHPNTFSRPFTYDLENGAVLTLENVFKAGCEEQLLGLIKEQLALQEDVPVRRLANADIYVDDLYVSPLIYLSNGSVVFHYNPYSIAPYSKGEIDVEVQAYELSPYLTPIADKLLNQ